MEKHLFSMTTGNLSPTFSRGSIDSPPPFSPGKTVRGYDSEALSQEYDVSFPVSAYTDFLYCSSYAYLRHVEGIRLPPGPRLLIGSVTHRAFQSLLLKEFEVACDYRSDDYGRKLTASFRSVQEEIVESAMDMFYKALGPSPEADLAAFDLNMALHRWGNQWIQSLQRFADETRLEGEELAKLFVPYRRVEAFYKAPGLGISGTRIDILENKAPLEIKSRMGRWAASTGAHRLQVTLQALAVEASEGFDVDVAHIAYVYDVRRLRVRLDNDIRRWALMTRDGVLKVLTGEKAPEISGCTRRCKMRGRCASNSKYNIKGKTSQYYNYTPLPEGVRNGS